MKNKTSSDSLTMELKESFEKGEFSLTKMIESIMFVNRKTKDIIDKGI